MKQLLKNILFPLCLAPLAVLISCGGGGSGNETNEDTAPTTLNGTTLKLGGGLEFNFNRLSGDATVDKETGFALSFEPTETTISTISSGGILTTYDMPTLITNISYEFTKTGENSGLITIRGDGTAPPVDNSTTTNADGSTTTTTTNPTVFVNQANGSQFLMTVNIVFGSNTDFVENIAVSIDVIGTSDNNPFGFTSDSSSSNTSFLLQDGQKVPTRFSLTTSETVSKKAASLNLVPNSLQTTGRLIMTFDEDNPALTPVTTPTTPSVSSYRLIGTSSDDQGFTDVTDQGLYDLFINYVSGDTANFVSIPYAWTIQGTGGTRALLTLEIPSSVNPDGTAISERTEQYALDFRTTETGRFVQLQPDSTLDIKGSFSFPFADQINN